MPTAYDVSFKHEILNEFIASIEGFITRNYLYTDKVIPTDIQSMEKEIWEIYEKLPFEEDIDALDAYDKRLSEIRSNIQELTPQPHR